MREQYEACLAEARRAAPRKGAEKILAEALPWLLQHSQASTTSTHPEFSKFANMVYQSAVGEVAIAFCFQRASSLFHRFKRIANAWNPPTKLKIIADPLVQPGAKATELLEGLKNRGAKVIYAFPEALAALDAIRNLTTNARSGQLTLEGKQVSERDATDWVLANLAPPVEHLRAALSDRPTDALDDPVLPPLSALVANRKIIDMETAGRELALQTEEVTACARRHPLHFGILEGPPLVLFKAVEGPAPPENANA